MSRIQRCRIGAIEVTAITDGAGILGREIFPGVDEERLQGLLKAAGKSEIETNFNAYHLQTERESLLVDCGPRDLFGEDAGFLEEGLEEAGIDRDRISRIAITHMHPDHIAGALQPDGRAAFATARLVVPAGEHRFWSEMDTSGETDEMVANSCKLATELLNAYRGRVEIVEAGDAFADGIGFVDLSGHTPGHCGVDIQSEGDRMLLLADLLVAPDLQLVEPNLAAAFDMDAEAAARRRLAMLGWLADENVPCSGGHFAPPPIARIRRSGTGFRVIAA